MINVLDDSLAATDTHFLIADGTDYSSFALSGDVTCTNAGVVTIAATAVEGSMLNNNIVSGLDDINAAIVATDEMIISDGGTIKRTDVSRLGTFLGGGNGLQVNGDGQMSLDVVEKIFYSASSNTGAASGMSTDLLTASLNVGSDGNVLADSLQVFLNGMLQTVSSSAGHTSKTGVFDYRLDDSTTPTKVEIISGLDADDILVVRYVAK